jgi:hypothetical protein
VNYQIDTFAWDVDDNSYTTGTGQVLRNVHGLTARCVNDGCVIHSPSDHPMTDLPTHWRSDRFMMERICKHGVGHPDPDDVRFQVEVCGNQFAGIHGCDGCCSQAARAEREGQLTLF